jgi:hypothetical protein
MDILGVSCELGFALIWAEDRSASCMPISNLNVEWDLAVEVWNKSHWQYSVCDPFLNLSICLLKGSTLVMD